MIGSKKGAREWQRVVAAPQRGGRHERRRRRRGKGGGRRAAAALSGAGRVGQTPPRRFGLAAATATAVSNAATAAATATSTTAAALRRRVARAPHQPGGNTAAFAIEHSLTMTSPTRVGQNMGLTCHLASTVRVIHATLKSDGVEKLLRDSEIMVSETATSAEAAEAAAAAAAAALSQAPQVVMPATADEADAALARRNEESRLDGQVAQAAANTAADAVLANDLVSQLARLVSDTTTAVTAWESLSTLFKQVGENHRITMSSSSETCARFNVDVIETPVPDRAALVAKINALAPDRPVRNARWRFAARACL